MTIQLPQLNRTTAATLLTAGAFATIAFDTFGATISPLLKDVAAPWLGAKLAPVPLANQSLAVLLDMPARTVNAMGLGYGVHVLTGLVAYPLGYALAAKPLARALGGRLGLDHWAITGAAYGIVLWVFALYVMAHLVAGNPPFLGFTGITWVALWGHMLFALIVARMAEPLFADRQSALDEPTSRSIQPAFRVA